MVKSTYARLSLRQIVKHMKFTQRSCCTVQIGGASCFINVTRYIFIAISTIPLHCWVLSNALTYSQVISFCVCLFSLSHSHTLSTCSKRAMNRRFIQIYHRLIYSNITNVCVKLLVSPITAHHHNHVRKKCERTYGYSIRTFVHSSVQFHVYFYRKIILSINELIFFNLIWSNANQYYFINFPLKTMARKSKFSIVTPSIEWKLGISKASHCWHCIKGNLALLLSS